MESKFIGDSCVDYIKEETFFSRVPFSIQVGEKEFIDDEKLDIKDLIKAMEEHNDGVKTSCPNPSLFLDLFEEDKNNYVVCISSQVSGCYNAACLAKNMYLEEHPEAHVYVFDSKTCAAGENNVMLKVKELADKGLPFEEVVKQTEEHIKNLTSL